MKNVKSLLLFVCFQALSGWCLAQESFTKCSAAFLGSNMVVNEYTTKGVCVLPATATGQLTVNTVDLSPKESKAIDRIAFRIAIRDKDTKTLMMYAPDEFREVDVQRVLAKCKKGDHIVLLTVDNQYALPHNEILIR